MQRFLFGNRQRFIGDSDAFAVVLSLAVERCRNCLSPREFRLPLRPSLFACAVLRSSLLCVCVCVCFSYPGNGLGFHSFSLSLSLSQCLVVRFLMCLFELLIVSQNLPRMPVFSVFCFFGGLTVCFCFGRFMMRWGVCVLKEVVSLPV